MKLTVIRGGRTTDRTPTERLTERLTNIVGPTFANYMAERDAERAEARRKAKLANGRRLAEVNGQAITVNATGRDIAGPRARRRQLAREQLAMFGGKVKP